MPIVAFKSSTYLISKVAIFIVLKAAPEVTLIAAFKVT